jgi:hypothetical protein
MQMLASSASGVTLTKASQMPSVCSGLQLALQLVEKAPIRVLADELLWVGLDQTGLVHPQRIETERVLRVVIPPNVIADLAQCLQRVISGGGSPASDFPPPLTPAVPAAARLDKKRRRLCTMINGSLPIETPDPERLIFQLLGFRLICDNLTRVPARKRA